MHADGGRRPRRRAPFATDGHGGGLAPPGRGSGTIRAAHPRDGTGLRSAEPAGHAISPASALALSGAVALHRSIRPIHSTKKDQAIGAVVPAPSRSLPVFLQDAAAGGADP